MTLSTLHRSLGMVASMLLLGVGGCGGEIDAGSDSIEAQARHRASCFVTPDPVPDQTTFVVHGVDLRPGRQVVAMVTGSVGLCGPAFGLGCQSDPATVGADGTVQISFFNHETWYPQSNQTSYAIILDAGNRQALTAWASFWAE